MPELSASDARHFANVDHRRRVAFVVTLGDDIVGIGRYEQLDDTSAEVAFNVSDAHQGRGLGSVLLEHLAPPRGRTACTGSRPRCCRRTARCSPSSARPATRSAPTTTTASSR
jgi:GNAT superfamily N-acetyltransferase